MACKRSMSQTYLLSLVLMAMLPVALLGYLWISDQYRQFEHQSSAWRTTYLDHQTQLLRREVRNAIDYIEFERVELEQRQHRQLILRLDNAVAQLDNLRQRAPQASRAQLLEQARDLLGPVRFGNGRDHYFIQARSGTAVLMPARSSWQGRDIRADAEGARFLTELEQARDSGGFTAASAAKPDTVGAFPALRYVRFYAPLDIYLGAISYVDDRLNSAQEEVLNRFANSMSSDLSISVIDRDGKLLFNRYSAQHKASTIDALPGGPALGARFRAAAQQPDGDFVRFSYPRAEGKPAEVVGYMRHYGAWDWIVGAGFSLDALEATVAQQRAAMERRIHERISYFALLVAGLLLAASLAAQRLALQTRRSLQSFTDFFAAASRDSSAIAVDKLPFAEFEQLAAAANRMIEQRSLMEQALRLSEQRFEMALDAAACRLWELDLRERAIIVDGSLFAQLGYDPTTRAIGIDELPDWLHAAELPDIRHALENTETMPSGFGLELRIRAAQGDYRWFSCRGGVVERDSANRPLRALGTAAEITARKEMEQELISARIAAEDANQAKSLFLSSISHELRTPLNGVLGYAQILLRDQSASAEQRHNLRAIESCGQHLLTLINDVLDLAKIESGAVELNETACDLYHLIDSVSAIIRERADHKGLCYRLEIDEQVPGDICVDEVKLRQILVNLLGNAVKFTDTGDVTLQVSTRRAESQLLFQVRDTGIGIAADRHQAIFQPFHQVGGSGTGLGLPISRRLCEAMGGSLTVQSSAGAGSCFTVRLPLKYGTSTRAPRLLQPPQQRIDAGARRLKVMVADDNPVNRQVLAGMLRASGIELVEAENGEQALALLRAQPLPLVLMDVLMPVMDGFATTRAIKSDPQLRDTVVIAVSASVFPDVVEQMRAQGCDDFISKPVRAGELLGKVARYLGLPLRDIEIAKTDSLRRTVADLPPGLATALQTAVAVGDIEAMRQTLGPLYAMPADFIVLAQHIDQLLDNFDIDAVRDLLAPLCTTA